MKIYQFFYTLLFVVIAIACNQKNKTDAVEIELEEVNHVAIMDDVPPPPSNLTSNFKNVHDWLNSICKMEHPVASISSYHLGIFHSSAGNVIFLVGMNDYDNEDESQSRIEFEPANMYFPLSQNEFANLSKEQLVKKLTEQLKAFTTTDTFKNSFLEAAKRITFEASGEVIWPE